MAWYEVNMRSIMRGALATVITTAGLAFAGLGMASIAEAQRGPFPDWCPGEFWDPLWGPNWDWYTCHGGGFYDRGPGWYNGGPGGYYGGPGW